jgi:PAT family beta-lactamase induction signal transducer AmpG
MTEPRGQAPPADPELVPPAPRTTTFWVSSAYFAEGLPYMIVRILSAVYFTDIGVKERFIGYLNFLGIPWNLKFLWAPLLDILATKRRWLVAMQLLLGILTAAIALVTGLIPAGADPTSYLIVIAGIFVAMAFLSATNDVAIDGYYQEGLTQRGDQAAYSGFRVMAYRGAMIYARSGLVALVAIAASRLGGANRYAPWVWGFGAGAATLLALSLAHGLWLPRFEVERARGSLDEMARGFVRAFSSYLRQERVVLVLIFISVYKLGDEILFSMATPFLMRELGITKAQYSWVGGIVGAVGMVAGAMLGGWWIKRSGLRRAIWPMTILMNFNIWAYVWLAWAKPDPATTKGISLIALVHGYEQFAAGIGSAALLIYLLRTCKPDFRAAHYAIGSGIMSLGSTVVGGFGGRFVEWAGYLELFVLAFFASIPSMLLLFLVPLDDDA